MIAARALRKLFGRTVAVADVSFEARDGAVTGLLGPNGAGKTTTLRLIAGLLRPAEGTVHLDDLDMHVAPAAARRRLGVLPETVGLYDRLTVAEHLRYAGALHGLRGDLLRARIEEGLASGGLGALRDRRAAGLSLGERRRVAFARALVHRPRNVVLDEPTNGLDVLGVRDVRAEIRRLASSGCAVIVSSHVMPEIAALCDRVVVLAGGRVVAQGTPAELLARAAADTLEEAFVRIIGSAAGLN